jgi:hypothetical protein
MDAVIAHGELIGGPKDGLVVLSRAFREGERLMVVSRGRFRPVYVVESTPPGRPARLVFHGWMQ